VYNIIGLQARIATKGGVIRRDLLASLPIPFIYATIPECIPVSKDK
jgi:hypothetical protein